MALQEVTRRTVAIYMPCHTLNCRSCQVSHCCMVTLSSSVQASTMEWACCRRLAVDLIVKARRLAVSHSSSSRDHQAISSWVACCVCVRVVACKTVQFTCALITLFWLCCRSLSVLWTQADFSGGMFSETKIFSFWKIL